MPATSAISTRYTRPDRPCPVCGSHSKGCSATADDLHLCRGEPAHPGDWRELSDDGEFRGFRRAGEFGSDPAPCRPARPAAPPAPAPDFTALVKKHAADGPNAKTAMAGWLGLPADRLPQMQYGFIPAEGALTLPECDAAGRVVGVLKRYPDGRKLQVPGGSRGLTLPGGWRERAVERGTLHITEGSSDCLAAWCVGLAAVGRPSAGATAGASLAADLVATLPAGVRVIVVGDDDAPGREGAEATARRMAAKIKRPVGWSVVANAKDMRAAVAAGLAAGRPAEELGAALEAQLLAGQTVIASPPVPAAPPAVTPAPAALPTIRADGWSGPPLPLPVLALVPAFPLALFPGRLADFWQAAAESIGCPADYVAVPALAALGAAAGRTRVAEVKPGYAKPPALWCVTVAPPSSGKSPALGTAAGPLWAAEAGWREAHAAALDEHAGEADRHKLAEKAWRDRRCEGDPPVKPVRPTLRQAVLEDATVEAAARVLGDNPRGVALVQDELSGFVLGLNQYKGGKGADRQFWMKSWAGAEVKVNRSGADKTAPPLVVPRPFVAVAGALCPALLPTLRGDDRKGDAPEDGFIDRFLLSYPDPLPAAGERWVSTPADLAAGYAALAAELLAWEFAVGRDGRPAPVAVPFDAGGRGGWEEFTRGLAGRKNALGPGDPFRATLGKLEEYGLRLAALVWCLRRGCRELTADAPIDADTMGRAAALVGYFLGHAERCLGAGVDDRTGRVARRVVGGLARRPAVNAVTNRELFQWLKDRRDVRAAADLDAPVRLAVDYGYLRPVGGDDRRPGPAGQVYAINPLWDRAAAAIELGDSGDGFGGLSARGPAGVRVGCDGREGGYGRAS